MHPVFVLLMLKEVQCFARVAARRTSALAAPARAMSQPAMSQAITRLERAAGTRLFDRSARAGRLTAEGTAVLPLPDELLPPGAERRPPAAASPPDAGRLARPPIHLAYPPRVGALPARVARRLAARTPAI